MTSSTPCFPTYLLMWLRDNMHEHSYVVDAVVEVLQNNLIRGEADVYAKCITCTTLQESKQLD